MTTIPLHILPATPRAGFKLKKMNGIQEYWDSLTYEHKLQYLIEYSEESKTKAILRFSKEVKGYKPSAYDLISFFKSQMKWLEGDNEPAIKF